MGAKKTTILAVDDEPHLLKLVAFNLEAEGFAALTTTDGRHALELVKAHHPDLVLIDLTMPEMDGFTLCQSIRQSSAVPIIILTARGQDQDKVRGFELGADDYLTKSFSVEELLARIHAVIRRAQVTTNDSAYALQSTMTIGPLTLDDARHEVRMAGRELVLAPSNTVCSSTWRRMRAGWSHRSRCWSTSGARSMVGKVICCGCI